MYQVSIKITESAIAETEERLFALGASSVSVRREGMEVILCAITAEPDRITADMADRITGVEPLTDEWRYSWMEDLEPAPLSPAFLVVPFGSEARESQLKNHTRVMVIDPRDAFGDGRHPTTRLCMELLEEHLAGMDPARMKDLRVLDMGTGTGILAIGASLLGAGHVDAVDNDPTAVSMASRNVELNGCPDGLRVTEGDAANFITDEPYNVIIANLLSAIVEDVLPGLEKLASPGAVFIISGISSRWNRRMLKFFRRLEFHVLDNRHLEDWHAYLLCR